MSSYTERWTLAYIDEIDIMGGSVYHGPKDELICHLSMKLLINLSLLSRLRTQMFSSAGRSQRILGRMNRIKFLKTILSSPLPDQEQAD